MADLMWNHVDMRGEAGVGSQFGMRAAMIGEQLIEGRMLPFINATLGKARRNRRKETGKGGTEVRKRRQTDEMKKKSDTVERTPLFLNTLTFGWLLCASFPEVAKRRVRGRDIARYEGGGGG
jgi:hypothetical protein